MGEVREDAGADSLALCLVEEAGPYWRSHVWEAVVGDQRFCAQGEIERCVVFCFFVFGRVAATGSSSAFHLHPH